MIDTVDFLSQRQSRLPKKRSAAPSRHSAIDVGVISTLDLNRHGGLETYVRSLSTELVAEGQAITWNGQPTLETYQFDPDWASLNRRLLSLMTRSHVRWMSRKIAESVGKSLCEDWLRQARVMHYVGTGWNLLGFPAVRAARKLGVVSTCWPAIHPGQWGDSELDFDLYSRLDAIFVQSDFEKDLFVSRGIDPERLVRCDLAPSVSMSGNPTAFIQRHGLVGRQLVLFIGRKCHRKGYHAVRQAVSIMAGRGRPVTLISIGADVDDSYPALPKEADLDLGRVDDLDKADALAACDVMALPSSVESFGIVYTEAWAYGKPVVCGPSPASQELVDRHGAGLVGSMQPDQLAKTLERLLDDPQLRTALGNAGRDAVQSELSWSAVAKRHRQTWDRLSEQRSFIESV